MLAAVCHGKKDLRIEDVEDRVLAPNEVRARVAFGGICGSDMHYFHRGAVGDFAVREPLTLGHEISGVVVEVGADVKGLKPGTKAALDPSRPCLKCEYCRQGRMNLCSNMYFLGSAGRFPHVQGGFAQHLVLHEDQIIPVPDNTDLLALSCAEPLSVGLHAVARAGNLVGKRVIVTGSGPIGLLTMRAAKYAGAAEIVATDVEDPPLEVARTKMGAARAVNIAQDPEGLQQYESVGGYFDVAFEASGSPAALASLFKMVRRGGRIVQLGMLPPGATPIPVNMLQSREIDLVGAFRANGEFRLAVDLIVSGAIDVSPILSGTYPLADATTAFELAGDRTKVVKLHLELN
ncbi:L-idonate 5-dehydrogenase [Paraburkholderia fynbosensis]|uniref:L-idonate 5-dehydrogenase (NAD(P)(+)) n=1 Tax=Paraburkholderia fynbosensis TaxID=1200993 RepID=A0A6J5GU27_9BURK|nr:L-idonate 5-dehydrogenase [Paraburkholderia fynbosensis]CAB3807042.1 L-idonate 5-dehydrogenase (NAD(P)(+)) [Paraburkholderia fynbosensis]